MQITTAVELINDALFLPGWEVTAEDHSKRFEHTIRLATNVRNVDTNRENIAVIDGRAQYVEDVPGGATAAFEVYVGDVTNREELALRVIDTLTEVFRHEAREAFRWGDSWEASLHPHRHDGMVAHERLTGRPAINDYSYGTA